MAAEDTTETGPTEAELAVERAQRLAAIARAGVVVPAEANTDELLDAWLLETTVLDARTGAVHVLPEAIEAVEDPAETTETETTETETDERTETQKAVVDGNPRVSRRIHRSIMNPVSGRRAVDDFDANKLPDPAYRETLMREISEVPLREMEQALGERSVEMQYSREFDGVPHQTFDLEHAGV